MEQSIASSDRINELETELDKARSNFRQILKDSSILIDELAKKLGSCVQTAKPHYEAKMKPKQVNEAESEHVLGHYEHKKMSSYNNTEKIIQKLHQDLKKSIIKSSLSCRRSLLQLNNLAYQHQLQLLPYFEMKAEFNLLLEEQRKRVNLVEENVLRAKMCYADALHTLEEISDEIHEKGRVKNSDHEDDVGDKTEIFGSDHICQTVSHCHVSSEDLYSDDMKPDLFTSLPSELKVRSSILKTTCCPLDSKFALLQRNSLPELFELPLR